MNHFGREPNQKKGEGNFRYIIKKHAVGGEISLILYLKTSNSAIETSGVMKYLEEED
jgi:hypothetical protein